MFSFPKQVITSSVVELNLKSFLKGQTHQADLLQSNITKPNARYIHGETVYIKDRLFHTISTLRTM